jgi:hypothetical protein
LGSRVTGIWHFGLDSAVVLGEEVRALGHEVDHAHVLGLPAQERFEEVLLDQRTPAADEAVDGPDGEGVAAADLEGLDVLEGLVAEGGNAGIPHPVEDVVNSDRGEGTRLLAVRTPPVHGVEDLELVVAVECHVDIRELDGILVDESGEALSVLHCSVDEQASLGFGEVVLGIDDENVYALGHITLLEYSLFRGSLQTL